MFYNNISKSKIMGFVCNWSLPERMFFNLRSFLQIIPEKHENVYGLSIYFDIKMPFY